MKAKFPGLILTGFLILTMFAAPVWATAIITSASGLTAADITPARDLYRLELGGGIVAGANGSFGGVRREINWDGVPDAFAAPNNLPADFFNTVSPRGVILSTPGTGFQVSANAGGTTPIAFGNIDRVLRSREQLARHLLRTRHLGKPDVLVPRRLLQCGGTSCTRQDHERQLAIGGRDHGPACRSSRPRRDGRLSLQRTCRSRARHAAPSRVRSGGAGRRRLETPRPKVVA
jgi:hypothetical protein